VTLSQNPSMVSFYCYKHAANQHFSKCSIEVITPVYRQSHIITMVILVFISTFRDGNFTNKPFNKLYNTGKIWGFKILV